MNTRVPLWMLLAACAGCLALGSVWAQAPEAPAPQKVTPEDFVQRSYPYLPAHYAVDYSPSVADWQAMKMTALGASPQRLSEHFTRQQCSAHLASRGLAVKLDLLPDADWKHYAGGGKFSSPIARVKPDVQKAVEAARDFTRTYFQELQDKDLAIVVHIRGEQVGLWNDGRLVLDAEKAPPR
jgi:hypothetical protein